MSLHCNHISKCKNSIFRRGLSLLWAAPLVTNTVIFPRASCCMETLLRFFPADISFRLWHPYPYRGVGWGVGKRQSFISSLIPLLVLIFVDSHVEFSWGEGTKNWNISQSCLAGMVPTLDLWQSYKGRGHFMISVWEEMYSNWGKTEIWDVICHENSIHWSCFRNLFISTCVGTVSQAGFCLSNSLLVS